MRLFSSALVVAGASIGVLLFACVGDDPLGTTPSPDASTSSGGDGSSSSGSSGDACADTCGGQCVDFETDPAHCGGCGNSCTTDAGKSYTCVARECGNKAVKIAMGTYAACLVIRDGTVWCWGYRETGILGAAALGGSPTPTKIDGLSNIVDVAVGHEHACALDSAGDVWCWGYNNFMQTGVASNATACTSYDGSDVNRCHVPRKVPLPAKAAQLSVGASTGCIRTAGAAGGDIYCWGRNMTRVISSTGTNDSALAPTKIDGLSDAVQVSVSADDNNNGVHACVVKANAEVWCWGANEWGQLGRGGGDSACNSCIATPAAVLFNGTGTTPFADVKSVHAMVDATCALRNDKSIWCWGSRFGGQTGQATAGGAYPAPTPVSGLDPVVHFAAGGYNAFAVDAAGNVKGWGLADYSVDAIGTGSSDCGDTLVCFDAAVNVLSLSGVTQIGVGLHSAAALRGGTVIGWGRNNYGQAGHAPGLSEDAKCPAPTSDDKCNFKPKPVGDLP